MVNQNPESHKEDDTCPIWPDFLATRHRNADGDFYIDSPRAGGAYFITPEALAKLEETVTINHRNDPRPARPTPRVLYAHRVRLTTWLVDQMLSEDWDPLVTPQVIMSMWHKRPLPAHERANRLLRFIAQKSWSVGEPVVFQLREHLIRQDEANLMALAWSESRGLSEMEFLVSYLEQNGWLHTIKDAPGYLLGCTVTVDGYTEIARQPPPTESNQAFVAMWFHKTMEDVYWQGIEPAIRTAGYEPVRIDNVEHAGLIDDAIIAAIRKARFVIADLTQGDEGARGGVYYEAGFAHGLGLPVIFTCREDRFNLVHFDTNHQAHILWNSYEDLKSRLSRRIEAVVGRGPLGFYEDG